jgi:hypothetical protein
VQLGLIDRVHHGGRDEFDRAALAYAHQVAGTTSIAALIEAKRLERVADDAHRPLESYRVAELAQMKEDIFDDAITSPLYAACSLSNARSAARTDRDGRPHYGIDGALDLVTTKIHSADLRALGRAHCAPRP